MFGLATIWPPSLHASISSECHTDLCGSSDALQPSQIFEFGQGVGQAACLPVYHTTKHLLYTHKAGRPLRHNMGCACIGVLEHVSWADHRPMYKIRENLDVGQRRLE